MASPDEIRVGGYSSEGCRAAPGLSNGPRAGGVPVRNPADGGRPVAGIASKAGKVPQTDLDRFRKTAVMRFRSLRTATMGISL